jgi:hypothetical protein
MNLESVKTVAGFVRLLINLQERFLNAHPATLADRGQKVRLGRKVLVDARLADSNFIAQVSISETIMPSDEYDHLRPIHLIGSGI